MTRTTRFAGGRGLVVALALSVAAVAAACGAQAAPPSASPSEAPTPVVTPTPAPTATPSPAVPGKTIVDLDIADDHDVSVVVDNTTGYPLKVTSGRAGDGMTVRWFDAEVVNLDDSTLRVTWVGLPRDEQVKLLVSFDNGPILLTFDQGAPPANSDATGYDRVLVLSFETPVSADEVIVAFNRDA